MAWYRENGRHGLPWRLTRDPYAVLVSEVMLQQTQVERVLPYYSAWLVRWPTFAALAAATPADVIREWRGLGYNRRAKYLHEAVKVLARRRAAGVSRGGVGVVFISPERDTPAEPAVEFLESLPGVGHYTARAVAAFAYNSPDIFVETNIRTVFFHHLRITRKTSDAQLLPLVAQALQKSKMEPRNFYAALMDYGSHLKRQGARLNSKSKHYAKQSKFKGSARELRGQIVRALLKKPATKAALAKNLSRSAGEVERELDRLVAEGLVRRRGRMVVLAT